MIKYLDYIVLHHILRGHTHMKIEWNKVTWYSKLVALALFVALPFIGFWFGIQYGPMGGVPLNNPQGTQTAMTSDYYHNVSEWQTDRNSGIFSIAYPIDFNAQDSFSSTPSADWRLNANGTSGTTLFTLTISKAFEPQTNFDDAKLMVGRSGNSAAVAQCLTPDASGGPATATSNATINGISFTVFQSTGAGAGNFYETTSYRTVHAGQCYAVEYTIHSSQIANYPPEYHLSPFDKAKLTDVLDRIVGTFRFL